MLNLFVIFSRQGLILFARTLFQPAMKDPIGTLIRQQLLVEHGGDQEFVHGDQRFRWKQSNEHDLVFVLVHDINFKMAYFDPLLSSVKKHFIRKFKDELKDASGPLEFGAEFDALLTRAEKASSKRTVAKPRFSTASTTPSKKGGKRRKGRKKKNSASSPSPGAGAGAGAGIGGGDDDDDDDDDDELSGGALMEGMEDLVLSDGSSSDEGEGKGKDDDEEGKEEDGGATGSSGAGTPTPATPADGGDTGADTEDTPAPPAVGGGAGGGAGAMEETPSEKAARLAANRAKLAARRRGGGRRSTKKGGDASPAPSPSRKGRRSKKGDWHNLDPLARASQAQVDALDRSTKATKAEIAAATRKKFLDELSSEDSGSESDTATAEPTGWFGSVFKSLTGGRVLTAGDVEPVLSKLKEHLQAKNTAAEVAAQLCASVAKKLEGQSMERFTRVSTVVKQSLQESIEKILTPPHSVDVLAAAKRKKRLSPGSPYVIVFVGINGVGKSTSLAKVAYMLKNHGHEVLIAACDTFRSGAVEQLQTHCTALEVPLYEAGYDKDAALIARDAIKHASSTGCDVVLVDTAGRMQTNEPLMRALGKLVAVNKPDLVLFVGEALVGNDGVHQVDTFNRALTEQTTVPVKRGIVLTKYDTIDDKVGAALSMVYKTKQPIVFVGTGQTYTKLKRPSAKDVVTKLLQGS